MCKIFRVIEFCTDENDENKSVQKLRHNKADFNNLFATVHADRALTELCNNYWMGADVIEVFDEVVMENCSSSVLQPSKMIGLHQWKIFFSEQRVEYPPEHKIPHPFYDPYKTTIDDFALRLYKTNRRAWKEDWADVEKIRAMIEGVKAPAGKRKAA